MPIAFALNLFLEGQSFQLFFLHSFSDVRSFCFCFARRHCQNENLDLGELTRRWMRIGQEIDANETWNCLNQRAMKKWRTRK